RRRSNIGAHLRCSRTSMAISSSFHQNEFCRQIDGNREGEETMSIRRREFLGSLGTASVAAVLPLSSATAASPAPVTDTWDMTWVDRVKGKYRAVFDSPDVSNGEALF